MVIESARNGPLMFFQAFKERIYHGDCAPSVHLISRQKDKNQNDGSNQTELTPRPVTIHPSQAKILPALPN